MKFGRNWPLATFGGERVKGLYHEDIADVGQFCTQLFSSYKSCPSLPFVATDDREQFQFLNMVR